MMQATDAPTLLKAKVLLLLTATSSCWGAAVIDLTYQLREGQNIAWPANPPYNFSILTRGHYPGYEHIWMEANKFSMPEHMGTHVDAPAHMAKGKWRMHQIPADKLVGPGVVVDIRHKVKDNPVYGATVEDLKEWESKHGTMPDKAIVLVNSGWASRYPDKKRVFNTDDIQDLTSFKYPSVTEEAARWLLEERNIIALGVDTSSPDTGKNRQFPVHKLLLPRNILIVENVANMNSMPPVGTTIVMGAINIFDGSGAPMRMLAFSGGWKPQGSPLYCAAISVGMMMLRLLVL